MVDLHLPEVGPAIVLSLLVGAFHTAIYVLLRGRLRLHVLVVLPIACVGAWVGQALGNRFGGDFLLVGDYSLPWASLVSWIGILVVVGLTALLPDGTNADEEIR